MARKKTTPPAVAPGTPIPTSELKPDHYYKVRLIANYDVLGDLEYEICYVIKPAKKIGIYRMGVDSIDYNIDNYRFIEEISI